jgi:hypothetical protein
MPPCTTTTGAQRLDVASPLASAPAGSSSGPLDS